MPAKPTKAVDKYITMAEVLLGRRLHKGDVKRILGRAYEAEYPGKTISPRTLETIITEARERLVGVAGRSRDELRDEARQLYESVVRDPATKTRERLLAQERIDRLLGLESPLKHVLDGQINHAGIMALDLQKLDDAELATLEKLAARVLPDVTNPEPAARPGSHPGGTRPAVTA